LRSPSDAGVASYVRSADQSSDRASAYDIWLYAGLSQRRYVDWPLGIWLRERRNSSGPAYGAGFARSVDSDQCHLPSLGGTLTNESCPVLRQFWASWHAIKMLTGSSPAMYAAGQSPDRAPAHASVPLSHFDDADVLCDQWLRHCREGRTCMGWQLGILRKDPQRG
jgi:hypothetical protein